MYAKVEKDTVIKFPYTMDDLRADYPTASISANLSDPLLAHLHLVRVVVTGAPEHDPTKEVAEQSGCVFNREKLRWETAWSLRPLTEAEVVAKADEVRAQRNNRLSRCDWTQVLDAQVDRAAWATYRQALRDLTSQEGFPFNVVWPQEP